MISPTTHRAFPGLAAVLLCVWSVGCTGNAGPAAAPPASTQPVLAQTETALPAVVLPDLSALAEPVQRQLRERDQALNEMRARPDASPSERAVAFGALGRVLLAARFHDEATACYRHAEALAPDDFRWPYSLAHAYLRTGDRGSAVAAFERALRLRPSDLPALVWLGETHLDDGRLELAQSAFARALSLYPQSAAVSFGAGRTALARQAYAEAAQYLERALVADGRASAVHYPLAMAYRGMGEAAKAEAHLRQRGSAYPALDDPLMQQDDELLHSAVAFEGRGMQALKSGDFAAATRAFREGLALSPGDASLRYWLGATLYASGHSAEAEREFVAVLQRSPDFAKAHFSLGAIADAGGRRVEAIERFRAAVRADPGMPDARLRLADDLRATGQQEAALAQYEAAARLDPGIVESWIGGAQALIALGRRDQAQEWLTRGRRIHPGRPELAELQARLTPRQ